MVDVDFSGDEGLAEIEAALRGKKRTLFQQAALVTRAYGVRVEASAKLRAPVDTGNLMNSISTGPLKRSGDGISIDITAGASYAGYIEDGTSKMAPQPFMGPAVEEVGPDYEEAILQIADPLEDGISGTFSGVAL